MVPLQEQNRSAVDDDERVYAMERGLPMVLVFGPVFWPGF